MRRGPDPLSTWLAASVAWWMILHSVRDGWRPHDIVLASLGAGFLTALMYWRGR